MKKLVAMALTCTMVFSLAACGQKPSSSTPSTESKPAESSAASSEAPASSETPEAPAEPVELQVVTTYAGNDTNAQNYKNAYQAWEKETGNTVVDMSGTADETFKTRVDTDFETNSEPDVLFYYTGADANDFIKAGKVVSIDDIRAEYPEYASNMDDAKIPDSLVDGKKYAVPVNGIWETMFMNTEILEEAGVAKPGPDYTWDQFLADCEKIKGAGYTPIACALGHIPHYWWEFSIFNHTGPDKHLTIPATAEEEIGQAWVAGMNDIKALYDAGYFLDNTLSATDDESFAAFTGGKAAFLIDGSWKVGGIAMAFQSDPEDPSTLDQEKLDKFDVTFVPGGEARKASDLIGGFTSGYYITKKAWDDPAKRAAAVSFVEYMSSTEQVVIFAQHSASALKDAPAVDETQFNSLQIKAMNIIAQCTGFTAPMQDIFNGPCRVPTFDGMPEIVSGDVAAADAVQEGLDLYAEENAE